MKKAASLGIILAKIFVLIELSTQIYARKSSSVSSSLRMFIIVTLTRMYHSGIYANVTHEPRDVSL